MSVVDSAITRLQELAILSGTTDGVIEIQYAPALPVEDAGVLPLSIAHITNGTASMDNSSTVRFQPTISVDFHFSRLNLKKCYTDIDTVVVNFSKLLGGDPTLAGTVDTINFPVSYSVAPAQWDKVVTQMLRFEIPLKTLETPSTT